MFCVLGADFAQGFRRAHDFDHATVFQLHGIAGAQRNGFRQIKQEGKPTYRFHGDAAAMAIIIIEHHGVGGGAMPVTPSDHFGCAQHRVFLYFDLVRGGRVPGSQRESSARSGRTLAIIPTTSAGLG